MFKKFVLILLLLSAAPAYAQLSLDPDQEKKVQVKLVAEHDGFKPGETFWVALRQEIAPGWHTYWRNPGDTGLATTISWTLPDGFKATDIIFPTPHKQPTGGLVNYGYEGSVLLPVQITAPEDVTKGDKVELKAKANWLVCQEVCIPESAELTLKMKVTDKPGDSAWASAFTANRKTLPHRHQADQTAKVQDKTLTITLDPLPLAADEMPEEAYFFPHDGLLIKHSAEQAMELDGRGLKLMVPMNETRSNPVEEVTGDVWVRTLRGERTFTFAAMVEKEKVVAVPTTRIPRENGGPERIDAGANDSWAPASAGDTKEEHDGMGLLTAILFALIGGIFLNLMPCVFPVLSLKALGLVQKSHDEKRRSVVIGGLVYLAGVLATFTVLGLILIALKNAGHHIGWGVQLQSPSFVAAIALVLFLIGFVLIGAATFGERLMNVGNRFTQKASHAGSFFTGALAVVVATPCTAPFMGGAIFYALTQDWSVTLIVLWALGIGLALPYVLLTLFPQVLLRYLPRPGVWMEHFKQFLAFPMWAAAIWMVWVLGQQNGATGVLYVLSSMLLLAFGFWLWKTMKNRAPSPWQYAKFILGVLCMVLAIALVVMQPKIEQQVVAAQSDAYETYSAEKLAQYRNEKRPVFVNMTAAWCITCLANEKAALSTDKVQGFFKDHNVAYLKGDWTNYDEAITEYLKEFGRSGVPIYVFYPADQSKEPIVLPQLLTPGIVIDTIQPALGEK